MSQFNSTMTNLETSLAQKATSDIRPAEEQPGLPSNSNSLTGTVPDLLLLEEELASNSPGEDTAVGYDGPNVDIVHVAAICPNEQLHGISTLVGKLRSGRRAMLFRLDLGSLLVGELIQDVVEERARCLLDALVSTRASDSNEKRRAIIFVAYDFGDMVVKTALFFASRSFPGHAYQEIFNNTTCTVFSGCFQRSLDTKHLQSKLLDLFQDNRWKELRPSIITSSRHIAQAVVDATDLFQSSKVSLRSRIISLFANDEISGLLHASFDRFIATLGLLEEVALKEETDGKARFPGLLRCINESLRDSPSEKKSHMTDFETAFLSRSSPDAQFSTWPPSSPISHSVMSHSAYRLWADSSGFQALCLYGSSYSTTHDAADKIFLAWKQRHRNFESSWENGPKALSFTFDSSDPVRSSLADMLASVILQALRGSRTGFWCLYPFYPRECGGWTEKSRTAGFELLRQLITPVDTLLMLHDFDECPQESRKLFFSYYKSALEGCEQRVKVIVTFKSPGVLATETPLAINLDEDIALYPVKEAHTHGNNQALGLSSLSAWGDRLQKAIQELESKGNETNDLSVNLVIKYAGLDREPSVERLDTCLHLLKTLTPSTSPSQTLDRILRLDADQDGLRWILSWLMCGYRPLTLWELATVLRDYRVKTSSVFRHLSQSTATRLISAELTSRFHFLVDLTNNGANIRKDVRGFLKPDTQVDNFIWNEVIPTGYADILEYCFLKLFTPEAHEFLEDTCHRYESYFKEQQRLKRIASPVLPDGRNILFYVIQSLPYHLAHCPSRGVGERVFLRLTNDCDPDTITFNLWAKANWAMSNPFSRTTASPTSILAVLSGIGKLSMEHVIDKGHDLFRECLLAAVSSSKETAIKFMAEVIPLSTLKEAMLETIKAGNEDLAISICDRIFAFPKEDHDNPPLSPMVLWATTWLEMDRLTEVLFTHSVFVAEVQDTWGFQHMSQSSNRVPVSLLILACTIGNMQVIRHLFQAQPEFYDTPEGLDELHVALDRAAMYGQTIVIQEVVQNFPMVLACGKWKAVEQSPVQLAGRGGHLETAKLLLQLELETNPLNVIQESHLSKWKTLLGASARGFHGVVKTLLEAGVHPDSQPQPPTGDSPLRLAIREGPHMLCIRELLEHGADPNNDDHEEPLGREILYLNSHLVEPETMIAALEILVGGRKPLQLNRRHKRNGLTALMFAVWAGLIPVVEWLLNQGADVNIQDECGNDALCWAVRGGSLKSVKQVLTANPKLDTLIKYQVADHEFVRLGELALEHMDIFNCLLAAGLDPELADSCGNTLLIAAVKERNADAIRILLEKGVNLEARDRWGDTAIANAIYWDAPAELRLLAEADANMRTINDDGEGLLYMAICSTAEVMKTVLEFRKRVDLEHRDNWGKTPLLSIDSDTDVECIKLLIHAGADINAQDNLGDTILNAALAYNIPKIVDLLLSQPELDIKNVSDGHSSPLSIACGFSRLEFIAPLLHRGADVNHCCVSFYGQGTPLIAACRPCGGQPYSRLEHDQRVVKILRVLVDHGADINMNANGMKGWRFHNCLSAAACCAGIATIEFLLEKGAALHLAHPTSRRLPIHFAAANGLENFQAILGSFQAGLLEADREGKTCLHWAAQFGHAKTVEHILLTLDGSPAVKKRYLSMTDSDGWNALCWAVRPYDEDEDVFNMGIGWSEPMDRVSTIRILLQNGADRDVKCQIGSGDTLEVMTPLELACRFNTSKEILNMLQFGHLTTDQLQRLDANPKRAEATLDLALQYIDRSPLICDICLGGIYGRRYKCNNCPEYDVCNKCIRTVTTFHSAKIQADGEPHVVELHPDHTEDYHPVDNSSERPDQSNDSSIEADGSLTASQTSIRLNVANDVDDEEEMEIEVDDESMIG